MNEILTHLTPENMVVVAAAAAIVIFAGAVLWHFLRLPRGKQLQKVREWMLWAVTEAEAELGSGTGRMKLRAVYDLFLMRFPHIAAVITFDRFAAMVDDALDEMKDMLDGDPQMRDRLGIKDKTEEA